MADVNGTGTLTESGEVLSALGLLAYQPRWTITSTHGQTAETTTIYISERSYTGSSTEITTGRVPVSIDYTPIGKYGANPWWNLAPSTCTISFYDDETGLLSDILDGDDQQFKMLIDINGSTEWTGFVSPASYSYKLYRRGLHTISANDRIDTLYQIPYTQGAGVFYSGRVNLITVLSRCLSSTGLFLGFSTHMNWFPYIGSNDLTTDDDPLMFLRVNQDNFFDSDGNPYSKGDVLEQILLRFQLRLYQIDNHWLLEQRERSATDNEFKVYRYDASGLAEGVPTVNYTSTVNVSFDEATANQIIGATVAGTSPIGTAKITYYHGNPFLNIFQDLSFEEGAVDIIGGTPLAAEAVQINQTELDVDGITTGDFVISGTRFTIGTDPTVYTTTSTVEATGGGGAATLTFDPKTETPQADNTAITFYEYQGRWARSNAGFTSVLQGQLTTEDDNSAQGIPVDFETTGFSYSRWVKQESTGEFAGGAGQYLRTGWWVRVPGMTSVTTTFTMAFKIYITGPTTTWWMKWSDSTWQTTTFTNEVELQAIFPNEDWNFFDVFSGELLDGGTPIQGTLTIEFWEAHELDSGGSQNVTIYYIDNVVYPDVVDSVGTPSNEATLTLLTYTDNVNLGEPESPVLFIGDGPTSGHISRLTVLDTAGTEQALTGNWSFLPGSASGFSIDQFAANQWLIEFGKSTRKIGGQIWSSLTSAPLKPYHHLVFENPDTVDTYSYIWQSNLKYNPVSFENMLSGTFSQFKTGVAADKICTVNVKPNTALLSGIDIYQGLVCDGLDDFDLNIGIYMVGDDDSFYVMNMDFTGETDTGLDLSTYNIIDIARNQVTGRIYGLGTTGVVYSWADDGTDFTTDFSTGWSDLSYIFIDNKNQHIVVSRHLVTPSTDARSYAYTLAGSSVWDYNVHNGSGFAGHGKFASGGRGYIYLFLASGSTKILNRQDISDGTIDFLQSDAIFGTSTTMSFDEVGGRGFYEIGNSLYLYNMTVINNPSDPTFMVSALPATGGFSMDYFSFGSDDYVVGCADGDALWSHRIGSGTRTTDRTVNDMRLVCTRQGWIP